MTLTATFTRTRSTVPNVNGSTVDEAVGTLSDFGFNMSITDTREDTAACSKVGTVFGENPSGGATQSVPSTVFVIEIVEPAPPKSCG
jgi:beta-lactam-binding protein with PASTA domain